MKYFPLLWSGLWRKRTRTMFTLLSVVAAFIYFYPIYTGETIPYTSWLSRMWLQSWI